MGSSIDTKRVTGIYAIEVPSLKKVYVGQSVDVSNRLRQHRSILKRGACKNKEMQEDWDNFGNDFVFKMLEKTYQVNLKKRETEHTRQYSREGWYVYNVCIVSETVIANLPVEHKDFVHELLKAIDSGRVSKEEIIALI
jgi:hypothetical protein